MNNTIIMDKLPKNDFAFNVRLKLSKKLRFRLWVGTRLIKAAAIIMGCEIKFMEAV